MSNDHAAGYEQGHSDGWEAGWNEAWKVVAERLRESLDPAALAIFGPTLDLVIAGINAAEQDATPTAAPDAAPATIEPTPPQTATMLDLLNADLRAGKIRPS